MGLGYLSKIINPKIQNTQQTIKRINIDEDVEQYTVEEVISEMKHLQNGKSTGPDNIPNKVQRRSSGWPNYSTKH